ncbi:MAG: ABC transporter permease [Actinomycetota bacterium]|nr:ABC transporter permease [Actinomycetota bacterium]
MQDRPLSERLALAGLAGIGALWVLGAIADSAVFFQPALFGLGTGAIIAAIALGLVVAYRASGVINFGHGAIATYITYIYVSLTDTGDYPVPPIPNPVAPLEGIFDIELLDIPAMIDMGGEMPRGWAALIALLTAALLGLISHYAIFRPLRYAPVLAKVVASVGIMLFLQAAVVLRFGARAKSAEPIFPNDPVDFLGVRVNQDRFWLLGTVAILTMALWLLFRYTRFGIATRASAENERFTTLLGFNADYQAGVSWVLATVLAGAMGILVAPVTGVTPNLFTVLLISSLAAALLGKMSSFVIAAAAGMALGIIDQQLFRIEFEFAWLPNIGIRRALPFIAVALAMVIRGEALPSRGALVTGRLPAAVAPIITRWRLAGYGLLVTMSFVLTVFAPFQYRGAMINSMVGVILALSFVVVTGYLGQISLMQMALAGVGAFAVGSFGTAAGMPMLIAMPLAVLSGVGFGLVAALPSLRTRGASLAVVTLASGLAIEEIFFKRAGWFGLDKTAKRTNPPEVFGIEFGPSSDFLLGDGKIPTGGFGLFVLCLTVLSCIAVMRLRRSHLGEQMLSIRANERAAAAAGVDVAAVKLAAFGIASLFAALGGVLTAYKLGTYGGASFGIFASLGALAFAYLGGIATVGGAITAGTLFTEGIGIVVSNEWFIDVGSYTAYVAGLFLIGTAVYNNEGIDGFQRHQFHSAVNAWRRRRGLGPLDGRARNEDPVLTSG